MQERVTFQVGRKEKTTLSRGVTGADRSNCSNSSKPVGHCPSSRRWVGDSSDSTGYQRMQRSKTERKV